MRQIAALVFAVVALAGCGGTGDAPEPPPATSSAQPVSATELATDAGLQAGPSEQVTAYALSSADVTIGDQYVGTLDVYANPEQRDKAIAIAQEFGGHHVAGETNGTTWVVYGDDPALLEQVAGALR